MTLSVKCCQRNDISEHNFMSLSLSLTVQHYYAKNKNPLLKFTIQACTARQFLLTGLQNLNRKKKKNISRGYKNCLKSASLTMNQLKISGTSSEINLARTKRTKGETCTKSKQPKDVLPFNSQNTLRCNLFFVPVFGMDGIP